MLIVVGEEGVELGREREETVYEKEARGEPEVAEGGT